MSQISCVRNNQITHWNKKKTVILCRPKCIVMGVHIASSFLSLPFKINMTLYKW